MMGQKGNALFLILIAVALFAALSYAITNSSRGGGSADREQAEIYASQIMQTASQVEQAVQRARIISGCSDTQLDFWLDSNGDGIEDFNDLYGHQPPSSPDECYMYTSAGANLPPPDMNIQMLDSSFSAESGYGKYFVVSYSQVTGVGTTCDDSSCSDLMLIVRYLKQSVCEALSKKYFGTTTLYRADNRSAIHHSNYTMDGNYGYFTFGNNGKIGVGQADEVNLVGKATGCYHDYNGITNGIYVFYHVLLARYRKY